MRRPSVDASLTSAYPDLNPSHNLRATPILINGVLFASNGVGLIEAFNPGTGKTVWVQEPFERGMKGVAGQSTRSVAYWRSGSDERLFLLRGEYLEALESEDRQVLADFGTKGRVNLHIEEPLAGTSRWTAGPVVVGDVIVIAGNGGGGGDAGWKRKPFRKMSGDSTSGRAPSAGRFMCCRVRANRQRHMGRGLLENVR